MTVENDASLELSNQLCFSVYSTAHAFTRLYSNLLKPLDVTYTQYIVLLALWEEDGLTVRALGDRLGLDSGTLTPLLRRLEAAGHVLRRRDRRDQRRVHIHLTDQGRAARPDAQAVRSAVSRATGFSPTELRAVQSQLERLCAALDDATHESAERRPAPRQMVD